MRRKTAYRLPILLAVCFLLLGTAVLAAQDASLRVVVKNEAGQPVQNIRVELLRVAAASGGSAELTPEFAELGISADALLADSGADHAEAAYQFAGSRGLNGQAKQTDGSGAVDFSGLQAGVYLMLERGGQSVAFPPCLVVLRAGDDLTSTPKTSETDTKAIRVVKWWADNMDAAGKRPASIRVTLLRDGVPYRKVALSAANNWQHRFHSLPASGSYAVQEETVADYQVEYVSEADVWTIINTYQKPVTPPGPDEPDEPETPEYTHVVVQKKWDDDGDAAGKRPASISVQLIRDGQVVRTAALSAANDWRHTFANLEKDGSYTVRELPVTDYTAAYQGNASEGVLITNRYTGTTEPGTAPDPVVPQPETVDIPVEIVWVDENDAAGKRPGTVTVWLTADGSIVGTLELDAAQSWKGVFRGVPADLYYSVRQNAVEEYSTAYSGSAATGFVITNTYTGGTTEPGTPPDPEQPVTPDKPEEPDVPVKPPEEPDVPKIPQTGAEMGSIYVLLALGGLLTLLGLVDLYRGRRES